MEEARHQIRKQILEVKGVRVDDVERIQAELKQLFEKEILPLLDQLLSSLSPGSDTLRIDQLEIDLGVISEGSFTEAWLHKTKTELTTQIQALTALNKIEFDNSSESAKPTSQTQTDLELLDYFLRTGSLAWWVDTGKENLLLASLQNLQSNKPGILLKMLPQWISNRSALQRMIRQFPLSAWCSIVALQAGLKAEEFISSVNLLLLWLKSLSPWREYSRLQLQEKLGRLLLPYASASSGTIQEPVLFWKGLLVQISANDKVSYEELLLGLHKQAMLDPQKNISELAAYLGMLVNDEKQDWAKLNSDERRSLNSQLWQRWKALSQIPGLPMEFYKNLEDIHQTLSEIGESENKLRDIEKKLEEWEKLIKAHLEGVDDVETEIQDNFSNADELYVNNAGLVILWPFLSRFFENQGLIQAGSFVNEAAKHRAVGLLQFLADGKLEPAEYLCGLNKILCGLKWDAVLDFGEPITKEEAVACEQLLEALIAHASILGEMSVDGLRGTFLLRKGILRSQPGTWQLHVEKETYDIVLERFPWNWGVVKLPWMEWGMEVIWS